MVKGILFSDRNRLAAGYSGILGRSGVEPPDSIKFHLVAVGRKTTSISVRQLQEGRVGAINKCTASL